MRRGYSQEFRSVLIHVIAVTGIEVLYLFLSKNGDRFSRVSFLLYVPLATFLLYGERILWRKFLLDHRSVLYRKRTVLLITTSKRAEQVISTMSHYTYSELDLLGCVILDRDDMEGKEIHGAKVVCKGKDIANFIQTRWVDGIYINIGKDGILPEDLVTTCVAMGVTVYTGIAPIGENSRNQQLDRLGGYIVLSTALRMVSSKQLFIKRFLDILGGLVGMLCTGIITIFLAPAIYLSSPGPVFFSQIRVGRNGRKFKIYKFRSMYMDAEERKKELMEKNEMSGFMFKMGADPRVIGSGPDGTRHGLGWFIRKTSLDEFPQFWNVLKGDMSLVGTRPPTVDEWEKYERHHRARLAIRPGLTGMWQVSGRSEITDFEEVVKLDMDYIQKWNFGLDVKILLKTILVVLKGSGAS